MKKANKFDFKTLLVMVLSLCLCLSMTLMAACGNNPGNSSDSSDTKEEEVYPTDTQKVTNGDFEFSTFKTKNEDFPVSSSIGWVRSSDSITTSSDSSSYPSGIINTDDAVYGEFAQKAGFHKVPGKEEFYNPHTPFYYGLVENSYVNDEETKNEDGLPMQGSKVLMIHNEITSNPKQGTAQKFTSSSTLNIGRHEYAKVSVWVLTHDLESIVEGVDVGAYIALQNTVNTTENPLVIKNIDTNDNWAKYTFYLQPSDAAVSSYKIVLGLGFGSSKIRTEYVEGFAYFDNVTYEIIDKAAYDEGVATVATEDNYNLYTYNTSDVVYEETAADKLVASEKGVSFTETKNLPQADAYNKENAYTERKIALSHARANIASVDFDNNAFKKNEFKEQVENQADGDNGVSNIETALSKVNAYRATAGKDAIKAPYDALTGNAIYFVHNNPTSYTYTTQEFRLDEGEFVKFSFWVNASVAYPSDTALTIKLNDLGNTSVAGTKKVDVDIASSVNTDKEENENFNNWREYVVYVSNTVDADDTANEPRKFTITFDFGATGNSVADGTWGLTQGYAVVAGMNGYTLTEEQYNNVDTTNYKFATKVSLSADIKNGVEEEKENNDSYYFKHGVNDNVTIKNGVATNVLDYKGVVANSKEVGGENDSKYSDPDVLAGIINTEYIEKYGFTTEVKDAINALGKLGENKYLQALMINNKADKSFGYIGQNGTFAAHTVTEISFKIKVIGENAFANFYLVNSNALEGFENLKIAAKRYTTDENGKPTDTDEYAVNQTLSMTITAADFADASVLDEGWLTVRFIVVTGDDEVSYRPEFWNGTRKGETNSNGIVLIDDYKVSTGKTLDLIKREIEIDYNGETPVDTKYTRRPTLVKYTNEDGKDAEKYKTYSEEIVVLSVYNAHKTMIFDYTVLDVANEIDNRKDGSETPEDDNSSVAPVEPENQNSFNWALQITSIIIASVLVIILIVLLIRSLVKKHGKNKNSAKNYYNRDSRDITGNKIDAKKNESGDEEVTPYDYDNMENNVDDNSSDDDNNTNN